MINMIDIVYYNNYSLITRYQSSRNNWTTGIGYYNTLVTNQAYNPLNPQTHRTTKSIINRMLRL